MMNNAQKLIEERKKSLSQFSSVKSDPNAPPAKPVKVLGAPPASRPGVGLAPPKEDKLSKIALLQVRF